jgi:4-hydroxybenzoate polyprenyltransferase
MSVDNDNFWSSRLDYFFVLRPMLFFPGWSTMMAGYFIHTKSSWFPLLQSQTNHFHLLMLLLTFALVMGSSFVLNQLKDIESDKKNRKLFIISNGIISTKTIWWEVFVLTILAFGIAFWINMHVGLMVVTFFVITGLFYNFSPARMKDRPWGSLIANGLMGWLAFAIGWLANNQPGTDLIIDSIPYLCFNTALYLFTTLPDREGDRVSGKKTLAVLFDIKLIIILAFMLYLSGFLVCLWLLDRQALVFYILSLPLFVTTLIGFQVEDTIRATKYGILFFAISICLRWPVYLILMIMGFFGTKWYFKKRFNFDYPNFSGK